MSGDTKPEVSKLFFDEAGTGEHPARIADSHLGLAVAARMDEGGNAGESLRHARSKQFHCPVPSGIAGCYQVNHCLPGILPLPDYQESPEPLVPPDVVRGKSAFQCPFPDFFQYFDRLRRFQEAAIQIEDLVEKPPHVQAQCEKVLTAPIALRHFLGGQPAPVREGKFHLVSVVERVGRRHYGTRVGIAYPGDMAQRLDNMVLFPIELNIV